MATSATPSLSLDEIRQSLQRLQDTIKALPDKQSAAKLSHYGVIPSSLQNALDLLHQAASSLHAGSTKFALMGKIDVNQATDMARDSLLPACQWIGTATLVVHQESTGSHKCLRHAVKQAARAMLQATIQLVDCVMDPVALLEQENLAAQRTGAVWEACLVVMNQATNGFCNSNRLAMRRELTNYVKECNETMEEFQEMIDAGPSLEEGKEEDEDADNEQADADDDDNDNQPSWEQFLGGGTDQYTTKELPIATAGLALVKCSRGCINVTMQACDAVGKQLPEAASDSTLTDQDQSKLQWISRLFDCAQIVGEGMTDLGAVLYPPIKLQELESQTLHQVKAMDDLLLCLFDTSIEGGETFELGREVTTLAKKLEAAIHRRKQEAIDAINLAASANDCS